MGDPDGMLRLGKPLASGTANPLAVSPRSPKPPFDGDRGFHPNVIESRVGKSTSTAPWA